LVRWVLLEGNRLGVTGALLTFVFGTIMVAGTYWTFEMQVLLTEESTVQTVLNTLLSGMILLVSIVVSINSIIVSHDITSVQTQEERIKGIREFRRKVGVETDSDESPANPASFLVIMSNLIENRARGLEDFADELGDECGDDVEEYANSLVEAIAPFGNVGDRNGSEFSVLWMGLDFDYGWYMDRLRILQSRHEEELPPEFDQWVDDIMEALEMFAVGKEYFKSLYYGREVSLLSRTLLITALPSILINATAILAISGGILPEVWIFNLPPLLSFVATVFTISLAPYLVLTSYILRLSTVARRTVTGGLFSLN
jgi:hypothetical protein